MIGRVLVNPVEILLIPVSEQIFADLGLGEGDDDEEEQGEDGDDGADVLDDQPDLAAGLHDKLLRHLAQDCDGPEPLALAGRHRLVRLENDDFAERRIPGAVGPEVRVPPDALPDLHTEPLHVRVPEQIPGLDPSLAGLLVVQHSPTEGLTLIFKACLP